MTAIITAMYTTYFCYPKVPLFFKFFVITGNFLSQTENTVWYAREQGVSCGVCVIHACIIYIAVYSSF